MEGQNGSLPRSRRSGVNAQGRAADEWRVTNETMRNIEVQAQDGTWMCLRPLDTKSVDADELNRFALTTWSDVIVVDEVPPDRSRPGLPYLAWGTLVCLVLLA